MFFLNLLYLFTLCYSPFPFSVKYIFSGYIILLAELNFLHLSHFISNHMLNEIELYSKYV